MVYDQDYETSRVKTVEQAAFVRNLNNSLNKKHEQQKHEQQKQEVRTRRNMLKKYLAETGDKNVLSIAQTTHININTLRRDLIAMKLHTKMGFIQ